MKKYIIILFCLSCNHPEIVNEKLSEKPLFIHSTAGGPDCTVYSYVIDSCEYIGYLGNSSADWLTHKGNCKHCNK